MDVFYRLHVDDKNHGSLFTLTVDSFYKSRHLSYLLRGHDYVFAVLLSITAVCVSNPLSEDDIYTESIIDGDINKFSSSDSAAPTLNGINENTYQTITSGTGAVGADSAVTKRKEAVRNSILKLIGCSSENKANFSLWLAATVKQIENVIPMNQVKTVANDIVSKCLHCCISYCEKMTSWKRLYNSQMTCFLQK